MSGHVQFVWSFVSNYYLGGISWRRGWCGCGWVSAAVEVVGGGYSAGFGSAAAGAIEDYDAAEGVGYDSDFVGVVRGGDDGDADFDVGEE